MECIFCKIVNGEIHSNKIYENDNFFSILDINQKVDGHSLVISKQHFVTLLDIPEDLSSELIDCIKKTAEIIIRGKNAEGFNIVNNNSESAGQLVNHFHVHLFPRKKNDNANIFS
ncbi:MAG: HIT domain-containing protein [Nanoarchaeota archaeon]|nr:HIT domain-containing protein [Nanoarchaeota archaeon]